MPSTTDGGHPIEAVVGAGTGEHRVTDMFVVDAIRKYLHDTLRMGVEAHANGEMRRDYAAVAAEELAEQLRGDGRLRDLTLDAFKTMDSSAHASSHRADLRIGLGLRNRRREMVELNGIEPSTS